MLDPLEATWMGEGGGGTQTAIVVVTMGKADSEGRFGV